MKKSIIAFLSIALVLSALTPTSIRPTFAQAERIPPYEDRLLRLSEIMGSLHFLTLLCRPCRSTSYCAQFDNWFFWL